MLPDHKQFLFVFCIECAKVVLTLSDMETVDRSPELHLEEIELRSLSEPADTETPGGRPAEASAETSGGRPAEASAETPGGRPAEASAETSGGRPAEASARTSGGRPAEASAETSGGRPAEDGHTLSPTSQTELTKRIPTWKVVYYGSGLTLVVAVWAMGLLPSVLIFSIVRSPVQVIYMYIPSWGDNSNQSLYKVAITMV